MEEVRAKGPTPRVAAVMRLGEADKVGVEEEAPPALQQGPLDREGGAGSAPSSPPRHLMVYSEIRKYGRRSLVGAEVCGVEDGERRPTGPLACAFTEPLTFAQVASRSATDVSGGPSAS